MKTNEVLHLARTFFLGEKKKDHRDKNVVDTLVYVIRSTAQCRFKAGVRLENRNNFAFFTTIVLSLGLVFIPLIQNADVKLALSSGVLNMMQIFLAVSVLVYSAVIGKSRYEIRQAKLIECADALKTLIRDIGATIHYSSVANAVNQVQHDAFWAECIKLIEDAKSHRSNLTQCADHLRKLNSTVHEAVNGLLMSNNLSRSQYLEFSNRYEELIKSSENHTSNDYRYAVLEMRDSNKVGIIKKGLDHLKAWFFSAWGYAVPCVLIATELFFILDMFGVTHVFSVILSNGSKIG